MERKFYVYEHIRPDTDVVFYVGKGHGNRAHDMRRGRNRWHKAVTSKLAALGMCVEVRLVADCLTESEAFALEIERIAFWRGEGVSLTNITNGGEGPSGLQHTEEWKRATSARLKGRKLSPEHIEKLRIINTGRTRKRWTKSPEAVERTAAATRGIRRSPETRALLREIRLANPTFKGRSHTDETKAAMSAKKLGRPKSEETKVKMRKPKSEAHKQRLREASLGKTHTPETKAKLSEMGKADWARRKAAKELTEN